MFSQDFILRVKENADLVSLVQEYVRVDPAGYNIWQSECPHPDHNDSTPSFRIWLTEDKRTKKMFFSWACMGCHYGKKNVKFKNYGSDCFSFVQWMSDHKQSSHKMNWKESIIYLAEKLNIPIEEDKNEEVYKHLKSLAKSYNANMIPSIRTYLNERGFEDSDIEKYLIGFNGNRISFPLFNKYLQVVGFSDRKIGCNDKKNPKYKNSKTTEWFNKRFYFYGEHLIDHDFNEIRITEGPGDVILSNKYGAINIIATLGTAFTEEHAQIVAGSGKTPCFCYDGDSAGKEAAVKAVNIMAQLGIYSKVLFLPDGKDMADLSIDLKYDIEQYIKDNAMSYWQYEMKDVIARYDAKANEIKIKLYPEIKKILNSIQTEDELSIMKTFVKNHTGIEI